MLSRLLLPVMRNLRLLTRILMLTRTRMPIRTFMPTLTAIRVAMASSMKTSSPATYIMTFPPGKGTIGTIITTLTIGPFLNADMPAFLSVGGLIAKAL